MIFCGSQVYAYEVIRFKKSGTYSLARNIYGRIVIEADNVTLYFRGYTVYGDGTNSGITISGHKNVKIIGPGYVCIHENGIYVTNGSDHFFRYLDVYNNKRGLYAYNEDYTHIEDCTFRLNDNYGIWARYTTGIHAFFTEIYDNDVDGIDIDYGDGVTQWGNVSCEDNGSVGLDLQYTHGSIITNCDFNENGNSGLRLLSDSDQSDVRTSQMDYNGRYGLYISNGNDNNVFRDCIGVENGIANLQDYGSGNTFPGSLFP